MLPMRTLSRLLAVVCEGEVAAGDAIEITARAEDAVTIADVFGRLRKRSRSGA